MDESSIDESSMDDDETKIYGYIEKKMKSEHADRWGVHKDQLKKLGREFNNKSNLSL